MRIRDMTPALAGDPTATPVTGRGSDKGNLANHRAVIASVAVADTPRAAGPLRRVRAVERVANYHCPVGDAQFSCGAKLRVVAWDARRAGLAELFEALSSLGEELCYLGMLAIEDAKSPS